MNADRDGQLSQVLGAGIESFDIPEDQFKIAEDAYQAISAYLRSYWPSTGGAMYPQGSMKLGTVTALIDRNDEYDLDMVYRRDLDMSQIASATLKADLGDALDHFANECPQLELKLDDEGRRCWTFVHDTLPFYLDILPAIPRPDAGPNGIWATDTEGPEWHPSAPLDYANWFFGVLDDEWRAGAARTAEHRQIAIDHLPRNAFKTTLQRTVQALKRHRDFYFIGDPGNRPSSIIITTLAALSYEPAGDLFTVLCHIVGQMPDHVESRFGRHVIANPVAPAENFADRWIGHPIRAERFFQWIEAAQRDFTAIGDAQNTDEVLERTEFALGARAANAAGHALATGTSSTRTTTVTTRVPAGNDRFA